MTNLMPVQQTALQQARGQEGFAYFMDMGLGKTLTALTEFEDMVAHKTATRMVVICPNSFKTGWKAEIDKHGFKIDVHIYESDKHKKAELFLAKTYFQPPVLIVHYQAVRLKKVKSMIEAFTKRRLALLVIDESIAIKNPQAAQTKSIFGLAPLFRYVRCLTGKPMTQGAHDLWGQLRLVGATTRNYYAFRNRFCRMGGWQGREVIGAINEEELRNTMNGHVFIAKKEDWLAGMPEKLYTTRQYELGPVVGRHFSEMEKLFVTWLKEQTDKRVVASIALTKYMKLLQIQCGFVHDDDGEPQALIEDKANPRLQLLLETLEESSGKVAVCFLHRYVGWQLHRVLNNAGYAPQMIIGGMQGQDIDDAKRVFNEDPNCRVILLQIQASKFGHTLLGDQALGRNACSTMIFYQSSYSLDDRTQIEDRIHRLGQRQSSVLYVDLVGSEMDERVIHALQHKENVYQAVMGAAGVTAH